MYRIFKSLKNDSGSIYVEFLAGLILLMIVLAAIISVLSIFSIKDRLDNANDLLLQQAEMTGSTDLSEEIALLKEKTGLDFSVSFDGTEYMPGSSYKVQLGDTIHITLSFVQNIGAGDLVQFPITVKSSCVGLSQHFHK